LKKKLNLYLKKRFNYKINNKIYDKKFVFIEQGYNLEPSELGAAFGVSQLDQLKKNIGIRQKNYKNLKMKNNLIYLLWLVVLEKD